MTVLKYLPLCTLIFASSATYAFFGFGNVLDDIKSNKGIICKNKCDVIEDLKVVEGKWNRYKFQNNEFKNMVIKDSDVTYAKFDSVKFYNIKIENSILDNTIFEDSKFISGEIHVSEPWSLGKHRNTLFENIKISFDNKGVDFNMSGKGVVFKNVTFNNVVIDPEFVKKIGSFDRVVLNNSRVFIRDLMPVYLDLVKNDFKSFSLSRQNNETRKYVNALEAKFYKESLWQKYSYVEYIDVNNCKINNLDVGIDDLIGCNEKLTAFAGDIKELDATYREKISDFGLAVNQAADSSRSIAFKYLMDIAKQYFMLRDEIGELAWKVETTFAKGLPLSEMEKFHDWLWEPTRQTNFGTSKDTNFGSGMRYVVSLSSDYSNNTTADAYLKDNLIYSKVRFSADTSPYSSKLGVPNTHIYFRNLSDDYTLTADGVKCGVDLKPYRYYIPGNIEGSLSLLSVELKKKLNQDPYQNQAHCNSLDPRIEKFHFSHLSELKRDVLIRVKFFERNAGKFIDDYNRQSNNKK